MPDAPRPQITLGEGVLCPFHRHDLIVHKLRLGPLDRWIVAEVTARLLMFQFATSDARVWKRAENDPANLTLVIAELGCLACWSPDHYARTLRIMGRGISHAAQVAHNKVSDPDSPFRDAKPPEKT